MNVTQRGYELVRDGAAFYVKEQRLLYDLDSKQYYSESYHHSQLYVFTGVSKDDCLTLVRSWLAFFDDQELMRYALIAVDDLYDQVKLLTAPVVHDNDDDKDMN